MPKGTIKFYNAEKGFGFIKQDQGEDLFFHISSSSIDEPEKLEVGQRVIYEIGPGRKGPEAREVEIEGEVIEEEVKEDTENKEEEESEKEEAPKQEKEKSKQNKEKNKSKSQKKSNKLISNSFWDGHIESGEPVTLTFMDNTEFDAKVVGRDTYHIMVEVDGKQRLIFKHALKWIEEVEETVEEAQE